MRLRAYGNIAAAIDGALLAMMSAVARHYAGALSLLLMPPLRAPSFHYAAADVITMFFASDAIFDAYRSSRGEVIYFIFTPTPRAFVKRRAGEKHYDRSTCARAAC